MKKIFYILFTLCMLVACNNDSDSVVVNSISEMYGTLWQEYSISVKYYDNNDVLFDEYIISPESKNIVGASFAHYYIGDNFIGYLLRRSTPTEMDREFPVYFISESAYQFDSSNSKLKIGDEVYSLIEFSPSRIKWDQTTYFDNGYMVRSTTLIPDNTQNWDSMTNEARIENRRHIEQYDNYTPPTENVIIENIEGMLGTLWRSTHCSTSVHHDDGKITTITKHSDTESITNIYYIDSSFIGRLEEQTNIRDKTTQRNVKEFNIISYCVTSKVLHCDNITFALTQFCPEKIEWSYTIEQGNDYRVQVNETLQPYASDKTWEEWKEMFASENE